MNVNMQQATQAAKKMADAGGDSHFLEEQMNPTRIKQYLDSGKDYDKVKGMKWLLAMMSKGRDASEFFSDVVKNVMAKSVEVKKMVPTIGQASRESGDERSDGALSKTSFLRARRRRR